MIGFALVLVLTTLPLHSATYTWDGTASGNANWSRGQNWVGGNAPSGNGHDIIFNNNSKTTNTKNTTTSLASITFGSLAGAFVIGGSTTSITAHITNNSTNLQSINMALGLNATITVAASNGNIALGGIVSGTGGITKTGTNQLTLTGANTFTGTTTVSAGTLLANNASGSATGTGAVTVAVGATLGGTGTITPGGGSNGITVNGTIAPGSGATPGTLTINLSTTTGGVTMASGSGFQFHLGAVGVGDMLAIAGANAGDFTFNNNNINFLATGAVGSYKIFDTSSGNANTWGGLTLNGNNQITAGLTYSNLSSGYTAIFYMGGGFYGGDGGDIYVQVIPEPNTVLLGGIGTLLLLLRHRRPTIANKI